MKNNIMILLYNLNIGGTEKALLNMLEVMDKDQYNVDLYLLEKKGGLIEDVPKWVNVRVIKEYEKVSHEIMDPPLLVIKDQLFKLNFIHAVQLLCAYSIYKFTDDISFYLKIVLKKIRPIESTYDVAIAYNGPFDFITMFILNKVQAKEKIQWIHFDVSKLSFNKQFAKKNYSLFNRIVVVSHNAEKSLLNLVPELKNKVEVIPNFLPIKICLNKAEEEDPFINDRSDGKKIILTVGRLTREKGQDIIPDIVPHLIDKGINNFVWYIVGEGTQFNNIKKKVEENKLTDYIKLVGLKKNPYPYYKNCDLYVQTSIHEGYCLTIAEALLFNKYVISTDVAGARDQIINSEIGVITKRNSKMIALEIERYLI